MSAEIISGVEAKRRARGDADLIVRYRSEDECACRGTETVDHHGFFGRAQTMEFVEVLSDLAASVVRYSNGRVTGRHIHKQQGSDKQTRYKFHVPPKFKQTELPVCVMRVLVRGWFGFVA